MKNFWTPSVMSYILDYEKKAAGYPPQEELLLYRDEYTVVPLLNPFTYAEANHLIGRSEKAL